MRLELRTSLLVNEPCPAFMELPLVLTVTGLVLDSGLVLAFDQNRHEAHLSLIDTNQVEVASEGRRHPKSFRRGSSAHGPTSDPPSDPSDADNLPSTNATRRRARIRRCPSPLPPPTDNSSTTAKSALGQRILPFLALESSVGDDRNHKHVLRNVGRVEQFVIQLVRRLVVDEVRKTPTVQVGHTFGRY